ncbi:MAG: GntR family transcriptional regulator, partial [Desulfobacterales bacterium]|nr:GntR family transcriptional regulator [Desulfobacterales bacterium]
SERAYVHIRDSLLKSGAYVGQKIPHLELGRRLGISQTPLREALFRLAAEGLITHENNKGFFLAELSSEEAGEIYEIREIIEPDLAKKAAMRTTAAQVKIFSKILDEYKKLMPETYSKLRLLTDKKFHMEIVKLSGNNTLAQILDKIYNIFIFKRPTEHLSPTRSQEAYTEHLEILEALKLNDGDKAAQLMRNHIRQQRDFVLADISSRLHGESMVSLASMK